ncbi:hypothetical protein ACFQ9V_01010 [Leifsonia sp. NPDC056665]|uniref:hypothetical protein n=1 Tax=Leifsonia sp. NPDC056665 TaxID=3345901 RepID=UPI003684C07F
MMITYLDSQSVSADYVFWQQEDEKIRAFLRTTNRGMDFWLREQWDAAEENAAEVFNPKYHAEWLVAELYQHQIGIWPADYFWQLSAAVIKDAVALYEVFLEMLASHVLGRAGHRLATLNTEDSWRWPECRAFYTHYVGVDVAPPRMEAVLWIRNKLAHLRDDLRTDEGRKDLKDHIDALNLNTPLTDEETTLGLVEHRPYMAHGVVLTQLQTWRLLDVIAQHVGVVAVAAFPYLYRGKTNTHLEALRMGAPIPVEDLSFKQARKLFAR